MAAGRVLAEASSRGVTDEQGDVLCPAGWAGLMTEWAGFRWRVVQRLSCIPPRPHSTWRLVQKCMSQSCSRPGVGGAAAPSGAVYPLKHSAVASS